MKHTLSVHVENKPGALTRITSMFARRGFNIESLAVGPTEHHHISRVTLSVDCDDAALAQIEKQMHKLVNVLRITELTPGESIERELPLDGLAGRERGDPQHVDELVHLLLDLREDALVAVHDDRHPRDVMLLGRTDRE